MRHQDQINDEQPDVVKSDPVRVPPPGMDADRTETGYDDPERFDGPEGDRPSFGHQPTNRQSEDVLDDHGSFDDPSVRDESFTGHPDADARTGGHDLVDAPADDRYPATGTDAAAARDAADGDSALGDRLEAARDADLVDGEPVAGDRLDDHDETATAIDGDRYDGGTLADRAADGDRTEPLDHRVDEPMGDDLDRTEFHEPAPQPTTFGAATVGGAAAAAAMAGGRRATEHDVDELDADRTRDGVVNDRADNAGMDQTRLDNDRAGTAAAVGGVTSGPVEGQPGAGVAPGGGLLPGAVSAEPVTALLGPDAAQGFRDRWRDVQLRFVDDPKAAVGEAQGLVDEAIEALASALSAQKNDLGSWQGGESSDTEQLRMVVRRYRDFLDRVLGL